MNPAFYGMFTKDEATAAQRTFSFLAVDVTDGVTPETGLTYAGADCMISKNGAAATQLAGAVTEIAVGLYKVVLAAGDLDTLGTAIISFSDAAARTVYAMIQVVAFDLNTATVVLTDASLTAAKFAADAITAAAVATDAIGDAELAADAVAAIQSGLATGAQVLASRNQTLVTYELGTLTEDGSTAGVSLADAIDAVANLSGTWDSSTVTIEKCADVLADPQVWVPYSDDADLTSDGEVEITGPVAGIRATMTNDGAASEVTITLAIRK